MPSKLIKKYSILHTLSRGKAGQSWPKANQAMQHKGNRISQVYHRPSNQWSEPDNHGPSRQGKGGVFELARSEISRKAPGPGPFLALTSVFLVVDEELSSFSIQHGLRKSPGQICPSTHTD